MKLAYIVKPEKRREKESNDTRIIEFLLGECPTAENALGTIVCPTAENALGTIVFERLANKATIGYKRKV